jgi:hypothetical protein
VVAEIAIPAVSLAGYVAAGVTGARRSTYPRVRRLVEASRGSRSEESPLIWTVDGTRLAGQDFLGIVVAMSVERSLPLLRTQLVPRSATTLVFRQALYELDSFEGFDDATHEAAELGTQIATAVAGRKVKVPVVHWRPSSFRATQLVSTLQVVLPMGALLFMGRWAHWRSSVAVAVFYGSMLSNIASTVAIAVITKRDRSRAAVGLLVNAAAALGTHRQGAAPFR